MNTKEKNATILQGKKAQKNHAEISEKATAKIEVSTKKVTANNLDKPKSSWQLIIDSNAFLKNESRSPMFILNKVLPQLDNFLDFEELLQRANLTEASGLFKRKEDGSRKYDLNWFFDRMPFFTNEKNLRTIAKKVKKTDSINYTKTFGQFSFNGFDIFDVKRNEKNEVTEINGFLEIKTKHETDEAATCTLIEKTMWSAWDFLKVIQAHEKNYRNEQAKIAKAMK